MQLRRRTPLTTRAGPQNGNRKCPYLTWAVNAEDRTVPKQKTTLSSLTRSRPSCDVQVEVALRAILLDFNSVKDNHYRTYLGSAISSFSWGKKMKDNDLGENTNAQSTKKTNWARLWTFVIGAGAVASLLATLLALGGTSNAFRASQCNSNGNWVREALLRCSYATIEDATDIIRNYYDTASSADPENGKVHLSRELRDTWNADDYAKHWAHIGWAEIVGTPESLASPSANTFEVQRKMYGSPHDSSTDREGYVWDIYEEITLVIEGETWKIAHTTRVGRQDIQPWTQYGVAVLTEDQPSFTKADTTSQITNDNWKSGGSLPVYCDLEIVSGDGSMVSKWVRTPVGWLPSSKVFLTANDVRACQPLKRS